MTILGKEKAKFTKIDTLSQNPNKFWQKPQAEALLVH